MGDVIHPTQSSQPANAEDRLRKEIAVALKKALDSGVSVQATFDVLLNYVWASHKIGEGQ